MPSRLPAPTGLPGGVGRPAAQMWLNGEPPNDGSTVQLRRILTALHRYRWIVLATTLLGGMGGLIASRFVEPVYDAQATVWIEVNSAQSLDQGPIRTDQLLESSAWVDLLRSFVVLDDVVRERQLYITTDAADRDAFADFGLQPSFLPGQYTLAVDADGRTYTLSSERSQIESGDIQDQEFLGVSAGFIWRMNTAFLTPGRVIEFTLVHPRDAAVTLGEDIRPTLSDQGNFLRLSLSGEDPEFVTATLNSLADRYVAVAADIKRAQLDQLTEVLSEQRIYAEENLRDAEIALESFRVRTVTLPSDRGGPVAAGLEITRDPVMSRYFELQMDLDQYRNDREAIQRIIADSRTGQLPVNALSMVSAVEESVGLRAALEEHQLRRAERRELVSRYTEDHPTVQRLDQTIAEIEQVSIPLLADELVAQIADREAELRARIGSASEELRQIPPRAIEEARLERQVSIAENLHGLLKQRYEEARLAAASTIPDIRVLDRAVPPARPSSDGRTLVLILGVFGSLGLSILGVILRDRFDTRVRYPDEVTTGMGLSVLGVLPKMGKSRRQAASETTVQAAEAFREIRMNLIHAHGAAGPVMVTITSPGSGDGKSFVTLNLGLCFADQAFRTLIVDGDTRRGRLHEALDGKMVPGLTDYLEGEASLVEVLQATRRPNVFFISAGTRRSKGPELLSSKRMTELLVTAKNTFDAILIDSPPLGAGVDAFALGTHTRNVILVLRTGTTDRALAHAKLAMVDRLPIRMLGAVLNGSPMTSAAYRYYSYLPGYQPVEVSEV